MRVRLPYPTTFSAPGKPTQQKHQRSRRKTIFPLVEHEQFRFGSDELRIVAQPTTSIDSVGSHFRILLDLALRRIGNLSRMPPPKTGQNTMNNCLSFAQNIGKRIGTKGVEPGALRSSVVSVKRYLAPTRDKFPDFLRRLKDLDGRGYLVGAPFVRVLRVPLQTALDQRDFMDGLLDLDKMQNRITGYAERRESAKELPAGSGLVLREIFLRGQIARGES